VRALLGGVAGLAALAAGAAELPGIGPNELTPETFAAFTDTVKMIAPPDPEMPQAWFSAAAEHVATVASATPDALELAAPPPDRVWAGLRVRITGSSPAAGQIRTIAATPTPTQLAVTAPFDPAPEPGDGAELFTGALPPGRWDASCSEADPCLDVQRARTLLNGTMWLWFDAGDVWDDDAEWYDAAHRPAGSWLSGGCDGAQNRLIVQERSDPALEHEIVWAVSSTDLTGATRAVFDCDARGRYPVAAGGLFENQNGSSNPASDHPTPWLLVQGIETRCWNRPAPGSAQKPNEWGEGTGVYRQEFSGKILALNNRHGELWDGAVLVSMNGGAYTQGDRYVGGIALVDVEAATADYGSMAGACTGTNDPFRSCNGTAFTGVGRGSGGGPLRPRMIDAHSGGDVLWVGGAGTIRNRDRGPDPGTSREFIEAFGFHDYYTDSGVGASQSITLVNLKLEGGGPAAAPESAVLLLPTSKRQGTRFETLIVNSSFRNLSTGSAVVHFVPWITADRATDTSLEMHWTNVSVLGFGGGFRKDRSAFTGPELDGGVRWTGRCLLFDGAYPDPAGSRAIEIRASDEELSTRCARSFVDVEGWIDGDDASGQFELCGTGASRYASQTMSGPLFEPGHAGEAAGWKIFAQGNSGDWGGEGVNLDLATTPATAPEVWDAVHDGCDEEAVYPLGQTLPNGFLSTASNPISLLRVSGVRDLGYRELSEPQPPPPVPAPALGPLAQGALALGLSLAGAHALARRRGLD
jgi:hypothetical protein